MTLFTLITISWSKLRPASQWESESPPRCLPMDEMVSWTSYLNIFLGMSQHKNCINSRILFVNLSFLIGLMLIFCWSPAISRR